MTDKSDFHEVSRQLGVLRRRLSLMRIYLGLITIVMGSMFIMGQTTITPREVEINRITFVTQSGSPIATLNVDESRFRAGDIVLRDHLGRVRFTLGNLGDSSPASTRLSLHDGNGDVRVSLLASDSALLVLRDPAKPQLGVTSDQGRRLELEVIEGVPRLALFDEKAKLRVLLGGTSGMDYSNAPAPRSVGSLIILDSQGNPSPIWKAP